MGRNGSGKSTLLKLVAGIIKPDSGAVIIQKGIRCSYLDQMVPGEIQGTVFEVVEKGLKKDTKEIEDIWKQHQQVEKIISQLGLDKKWVFNTLSAGMKRQVLLGQALVAEPDVLLLDEPTNHLDIDSIKRLEDMLLRFTGSVLLVTHDRIFLQNIATRIVEIDRGKALRSVVRLHYFSYAAGGLHWRKKKPVMRCSTRNWRKKNNGSDRV